MSNTPVNISPTLPIDYASSSLLGGPTRATRVMLLVWILVLFWIGASAASLSVAEVDLKAPLTFETIPWLLVLGDSVAMGIAMFALAIRRPATWPLAFGLSLAAAVPPLLMILAIALLSLSGLRMNGRAFRLLQETLLMSGLSILLWVNLGLATFLTRPKARWTFKAEVLKTPTAKHATWIVAALWALLILARFVISAV
jgi:hypothetical protein